MQFLVALSSTTVEGTLRNARLLAVSLQQVCSDCLSEVGVPAEPSAAFLLILQWVLSVLQLPQKFSDLITLCGSHAPVRHFGEIFLHHYSFLSYKRAQMRPGL